MWKCVQYFLNGFMLLGSWIICDNANAFFLIHNIVQNGLEQIISKFQSKYRYLDSKHLKWLFLLLFCNNFMLFLMHYSEKHQYMLCEWCYRCKWTRTIFSRLLDGRRLKDPSKICYQIVYVILVWNKEIHKSKSISLLTNYQ